MFYGQYQTVIDAKSRLSIPRAIRDELSLPAVIIGKGRENALYGYDKAQFETLHAQVIPKLEDEDQKARRELFRNAFVVRVDDQGRVVVPQRLLEMSHMGELPQQLTIIGAGEHFEIWGASVWEAKEKELEDE